MSVTNNWLRGRTKIQAASAYGQKSVNRITHRVKFLTRLQCVFVYILTLGCLPGHSKVAASASCGRCTAPGPSRCCSRRTAGASWDLETQDVISKYICIREGRLECYLSILHAKKLAEAVLYLRPLRPLRLLREAIQKKKRLSSGHCQKRGGGGVKGDEKV